ncbi:MAG: type II secretion system minor pseudopilin GspK [Parvularculaceae bacterium]|nr:type II secretion system minor pseudopilin GspK [Parvularculaceae bacterium]
MALVIVLLLVATLSFVLLSLTTIVTTGVRRGASERARSEMLWQALAAERVALAIIAKAAAGGALQTATNEGGLFRQQLALPMERGEVVVRFADASRCFNVNSIISEAAPYEIQATEKAEFGFLLEAAGLVGNEAQGVVDAVSDFLDSNSSQETQGAEDSFYTSLTTPYRTSGGPIASVSELRAVEGVTREIYGRIAPFLCARAPGQKIDININALTPERAPLIYALTEGQWSVDQVASQIAQTPPGGWQPDTSQFWAAFPGGGSQSSNGRTTTKSTWIEARVFLEADRRFVEETLIIQAPNGGDPSLYSRVFGGGD